MILVATGTFGESPARTRVTWIDGTLYYDESRVEAAFVLAGLQPVVCLPEVIHEPLKDPLGFVGVANSVLQHVEFTGTADAMELLEPAPANTVH